ncbi:hypothetical protein EDB86DRAFT_453339 [Lactarius hatsudake]|nr:hypothetical protein EDB86DRAFT_453339 [Lactarius hatsudake]
MPSSHSESPSCGTSHPTGFTTIVTDYAGAYIVTPLLTLIIPELLICILHIPGQPHQPSFLMHVHPLFRLRLPSGKLVLCIWLKLRAKRPRVPALITNPSSSRSLHPGFLINLSPTCPCLFPKTEGPQQCDTSQQTAGTLYVLSNLMRDLRIHHQQAIHSSWRSLIRHM